MKKTVVDEFEARRVERTLRALWPGLLAHDEALQVLGGELEAGWLGLRWELANAARSMVYLVEVRTELKSQDLRERQAVELLYDFLAAEFDDFLHNGRNPFTGPKWEAVQFAGKQLHTRGQVLRQTVEDQATALLDQDAVQRSRALQSQENTD